MNNISIYRMQNTGFSSTNFAFYPKVFAHPQVKWQKCPCVICVI